MNISKESDRRQPESETAKYCVAVKNSHLDKVDPDWGALLSKAIGVPVQPHGTVREGNTPRRVIVELSAEQLPLAEKHLGEAFILETVKWIDPIGDLLETPLPPRASIDR